MVKIIDDEEMKCILRGGDGVIYRQIFASPQYGLMTYCPPLILQLGVTVARFGYIMESVMMSKCSILSGLPHVPTLKLAA